MRLTGLFDRLSTRIKLGAMIVVIGGGMSLLYLIGLGRHEVEAAHRRAAVHEAMRHNAGQLRHIVDTLRQDALFLSAIPPVGGIIRAAGNHGYDTRESSSRAKWERRLQEIFTAFSAAHPEYYQIRYIGLADGGREIVRVDNLGGHAEVTPHGKLQRKGERDYFRAALNLKKREVYLSEFNLNREWGRIERPYRPTLRAATPVFTPAGEMFGVVVINMSADGLLKALAYDLPSDARAYVANERGDYLLHPQAERTFGFDLGTTDRITQAYPELETMFAAATQDSMQVRRIDTAVNGHDLSALRIHFDQAQPSRFLLLAYDVPDAGMAGHIYAALDRRTVIGGLIAMLLAGAIVWFVLRRIFEPLSRLTAAARQVAGGDLSAALPPAETGEVGDLVLAIRSMLASIEEREKDLRIAASTFETQEAIMITDATPRVLRVNRAFSDITGYASGEVLGKNPRLLSPDRLEADFYRKMWATLLSEGKWSGELWGRRKNGEGYPRGQTITAVRDDAGRVTHYVSIFSDIGERVRSEKQVRQMADELRLQNEQLQHYKSRIVEEREMARNLLSQFSALDMINDPAVRFHMRPMDEFSGDLVAAARAPDGRLHVLLADGTGHGLNASLSVAPLAQLFYQMTHKGFDISSIVAEMNHRVRSYLPLPRYVAAILVSIETSVESAAPYRMIRVWNGGCPPAALLRKDGEVRHHFRSRHLPLGIVSRENFDNSLEYFESGGEDSRLLLCSDGLTELTLASGVPLGESGLLYRTDGHRDHFDSLLGLVDNALRDRLPADDISLMLVGLPELHAKTETESMQADALKWTLVDTQILDSWHFSLTLTADQLKRVDTTPLILNVASQFEAACADSKLFVVLAELFNNALDHGLLKLDSRLKSGANGMELYYEERSKRLMGLERGVIEIHLERLLFAEKGGIRLHFRDSGDGFDYASLGLNDIQAKHGRGITLLRSLCSRLEYQGNGSEVVAVLMM